MECKPVMKKLILFLLFISNVALADVCYISEDAKGIYEIDKLDYLLKPLSDCKAGDTLSYEILGGKNTKMWANKQGKRYALNYIRAHACDLRYNAYIEELNSWIGLTCIYKK